jgi:hypothetical protein
VQRIWVNPFRALQAKSRALLGAARAICFPIFCSYLSVTATVAEWLTLPAVPLEAPVIVRVPVSGGFDPPPQPAKAMRITTAVANPSRRRRPLVFGSKKSNISAKSTGTIWSMEIGGVRTGGSGTSSALLDLVSVTCTDCAVTPSAAVIGVAIVQVEPVGAPVQVKATL